MDTSDLDRDAVEGQDARAPAGRDSAAAQAQETAWRAHYEAAVRSYLTGLVGEGRAGPAIERAHAELAGGANGAAAATPDVTTVRTLAQRVGLDALDAEAHQLGRRMVMAATRRGECSAVARRLRDRAEGRISSHELGKFYYHLEGCKACGAIAGRFDALGWQLLVALGSAKPPATIETGANELTAGEPVIHVQAMPPEPPLQAPGALTGAVSSTPASTAPHYRRRRGMAALGVVVAAIVAVVVLHKPASKQAAAPSAPAHKTSVAPGAAAGVQVSTHVTRTPFEIAGARFAVFANPAEPWASFTNRVSAGSGMRWELVTVRVRNLTRTNLDPRALHYRLITPAGVTYLPNLAYGTGPDVKRPPRPLAPEALVEAKVAFQVPVSATGLELAFDPTGRNIRIVVPLGS
jgi:hypothetical protein